MLSKDKIFAEVISLREDVKKLMALVVVESTKIDAVNAAVATLMDDTSKSLTDIAAEIASLKGTLTADPVASAALDSILGKVNTLNSTVVAADPGAIIPAPNPTPGTP